MAANGQKPTLTLEAAVDRAFCLCRAFVFNGRMIYEIWRADWRGDGSALVVERIAATLLSVARFASLSEHLKYWIAGKYVRGRRCRQIVVEVYVTLTLALSLAVLFCGLDSACSTVFAWYVIVETMVQTLAARFVSRFAHFEAPRSSDRSTLLALFGLGVITVGFAILYAGSGQIAFDSSASNTIGPGDGLSALYFAITTAATVGFGDAAPYCDVGRRLVVSQITMTLVFVSVMLATFVGKRCDKDQS